MSSRVVSAFCFSTLGELWVLYHFLVQYKLGNPQLWVLTSYRKMALDQTALPDIFLLIFIVLFLLLSGNPVFFRYPNDFC